MFNSKEYEWADINVVMAGRPVTGFRSVKYSSKQERKPCMPRATSHKVCNEETSPMKAPLACCKVSMKP